MFTQIHSTTQLRIPLLKRILQEPLLHFLVVGGLLFFYLSNNDTVTKPEIVISEGKINQLTAQFSKTRQRSPNEDELKALIDNQVREDLAFNHGTQMGLVENDTIIKRRVQQKIEFMLNDSIASIEPTKEELQSYLDIHKEKYTIAPVYSFKHVYINPEKHENVKAFIESLQNDDLDETYLDSGDRILLESEYKNISTAQIARLYGLKFAKSFDDILLGLWQGPVKSGYGLHLVKIDKKSPKRVGTLEEMMQEVKRDFRLDTQKKAVDAFYDELLNQYTVSVGNKVK